jgi:hypothetical protein
MTKPRPGAFAGYSKQGGLVPHTVASIEADIKRLERTMAEAHEALRRAKLAAMLVEVKS